MHSSLLKNFLLPLGDIFFGQRMMSRLKFLEMAQWWEREKIYYWQNENIQRLIQTAYQEVPFYRHLFDTNRIIPEEIRTRQDLRLVPIISKDMLRAGYPELTTRSTGQKTYEASTSGSSGKNFFVREDPYTAGWYRASFLLSLEWAGWSVGDPHLQTGMTLTRSLDRKLKDRILNCQYVSAYSLNDANLECMLERIEKYRLKFIFGYPGSLYYLAKYARKKRWNQPIKSAVTWGDMLYPNYRKEIEEVFQTHVYDTYGCAEGFHIAAQCGNQSHYHIHDFDVIVDIVDEENQPVKNGYPGHVIITRLHPGPMPFIRYRIGDMAVLKDGICECGRELHLLENIQGRDTDIVLTPGGNRLIVHFFTGVLEHFAEIDTFQVVQEEKESITIYIVPKTAIDFENQKKIVESLKKKGTDELQINLSIVDEIPFEISGKRRFVINRLKNEW